MNDGTLLIIENCVVLIFPVVRVADIATLLAALEIFTSEIPAAWSLKNIPSNCCHVADLRCRSMRSGVGQRAEFAANSVVLSNLRERHQRSNL